MAAKVCTFTLLNFLHCRLRTRAAESKLSVLYLARYLRFSQKMLLAETEKRLLAPVCHSKLSLPADQTVPYTLFKNGGRVEYPGFKYMVAWRHGTSLLVFNSISHPFAALTRNREISSRTLEEKFRMSARSCIVLYAYNISLLFYQRWRIFSLLFDHWSVLCLVFLEGYFLTNRPL